MKKNFLFYQKEAMIPSGVVAREILQGKLRYAMQNNNNSAKSTIINRQ